MAIAPSTRPAVHFQRDYLHEDPNEHSVDPLLSGPWLSERPIIAGALRKNVASRLSGKNKSRCLTVASRHLNCTEFFLAPGPTGFEVVRRSCEAFLLCPGCSEKRAADLARLDAARVAFLEEKFPALRLLFVTLTAKEAVDLRVQVLALKARLRRIRRRRTFRFVKAWIAQVHPERGVGGGWRAHIHMILAIDYRGSEPPADWFKAELERLLERDEVSGAALPGETWHIRRFFRTTRLDRARLAQLEMTAPWQAFRASRYSARMPQANVHDRIERSKALMNIRPRSVFGRFRSIATEEALRARWRALTIEARTHEVDSQCGDERDTAAWRERLKSVPLFVEARARRAVWKRGMVALLLAKRARQSPRTGRDLPVASRLNGARSMPSLKKKFLSMSQANESQTRSWAEAKAAMDRAVLLCEEQGLSIRAASEKERVSREVLATRVPPRPKCAIPDEDVPDLVRALETMTEGELAGLRGVSTRTIRRTLRRAGVHALPPGRRKKAREAHASSKANRDSPRARSGKAST